jgi:hypothetical protein
MSAANFTDQHELQERNLEYRTVSKAAVVCVVFAIIGLLAYVFSGFVVLPFLSVCFGIIALINFKRFPDQLSGQIVTRVAIAASVVVFVSSLAMHAVIYATEVKDGYQRISFYELKPKKNEPTPYSTKSTDFDGKQVFLKGYVRPGLKKNRLKKFILVGDFGACCFGGDPKISEVVAVSIQNEDQFVNYGYRLRKIHGNFKLHKRAKSVREKDLPHIIYEIEADDVQ